MIKGTAASAGVAVAPVTIMHTGRESLAEVFRHEDGAGIGAEAFARAVERTAAHIREAHDRLSHQLPEAASLVFTAHLMMLKDSQFTGVMADRIAAGVPARDAVLEVANRYVGIFESSPHDYMREKVNDIRDLARRLLVNLLQPEAGDGADTAGRIVVSHDLYPSDIVKLVTEGVAGIVLSGGGVTSHVAIIARSLRIPMVITDQQALLDLTEGTLLVVDGNIGNVYVSPSDAIAERFRNAASAGRSAAPAAWTMRERTETRDGVRVRLLANINLLSEVDRALELRAEGIGLYRTELPFLVRPNFPSEEEQVVVYRTLFERMGERDVVVRTLDVGGDKALAYYDHGNEQNPALGLRSIRFSLRHQDIFEQQIAAILRAGHHVATLSIMFPMIGSVDELLEVREVVARCVARLGRENRPHHGNPAIGIMIELPSAVAVIGSLLRHVDFLSIGTNDLVQYMLGVDRGNELVASYYRPHHPAVLRALAHVVRSAARAGVPFSVCGEMAHQAPYIPFLIGIGVRALSVEAQSLPAVQELVCGLDARAAAREAAALLRARSIAAVERRLFGNGPAAV